MNESLIGKQGTVGQLCLADGRRLSFTQYGDINGEPVIYCHGLPSSKLEARLVHDAASKSAIRLVAIDRPGVGNSDYQNNRTLLCWPDDVRAVADYLGFTRFAVLGVSGGAPYAAACARSIPQRLSKVIIVAGLGPVTTPGRWSGMPLFARLVLGLANRSPSLLHVSLMFLVPGIRLFLPLLYRFFSGTLARADQEILREREIQTTLSATFRQATRQGLRGVWRELLIATQTWEFSLRDITVPVELWHGDADHMVPVRFGEYLADEIPHCRARFLPGLGHYSLPFLHAGEVFSVINERANGHHAMD